MCLLCSSPGPFPVATLCLVCTVPLRACAKCCERTSANWTRARLEVRHGAECREGRA